MNRSENRILSNGVNKLAELDTTILRYNREYPNVGFFTRQLLGGPSPKPLNLPARRLFGGTTDWEK